MEAIVAPGDIADCLALLDVWCDRCGRRGRLRVARLVAAHGPDMGLPQLRRIVAADCPRWSGSEYNQCGVHYPQLVGLDLTEHRGEGGD